MKYISLLRGINVAGKKKVKMADLKKLYDQLGFIQITTYIQSGNVVFDTDESSDLQGKIEKKIQDRYGFHVPVVIRKHNELAEVLDVNPFNQLDLAQDGSKVSVTFLSEKPSADKATEIQGYVKSSETLYIIEKEAYLHCPNGYGTSKLSNTFLEKKLGVQATTRNWKTVRKLHELSMPKC